MLCHIGDQWPDTIRFAPATRDRSPFTYPKQFTTTKHTENILFNDPKFITNNQNIIRNIKIKKTFFFYVYSGSVVGFVMQHCLISTIEIWRCTHTHTHTRRCPTDVRGTRYRDLSIIHQLVLMCVCRKTILMYIGLHFISSVCRAQRATAHSMLLSIVHLCGMRRIWA